MGGEARLATDSEEMGAARRGLRRGSRPLLQLVKSD